MSKTNFNPKDYFWFTNFKPEIEIDGGNSLPVLINDFVIVSVVENFIEKRKTPEIILSDLFKIIEFEKNMGKEISTLIYNTHAEFIGKSLPEPIEDDNKSIIHFDTIVSDMLNMNVFFIENEQQKKIIDCINEHYKTDIDDFFSLQINLDNGKKYVFVITGELMDGDIEDCGYVMMAQSVYNLKQADIFEKHNADITEKVQRLYFNKRYDLYKW